MEDYHVFSSENLTEWTDHGVIVTQQTVPWGKPDGYSMWAPDCVQKDGCYYFYFPNAPKSGRGFAIGVATSDCPEGPFICEPEPIRGISGIDPCVLIDDDGTAYIYWSGMGLRGARLKANMKELDGELQEVKFPRREGQPEMPPMLVGGQTMEGLPDGFKEGPFAFKRDGWYYLTFPWVRQEGGTETLAYAMSRSPLGPWDFKGVFMQEHDNRCWTNHHSFVQYRGEWYLFYHRNDFSPRFDKLRSARIDRVIFRPDGTIQEVHQTMRGVGINQATERIDIDRYSAASEDVTTEFVDTSRTFRSWFATLPQRGSWLRYDDVDFSGITDGYLVICIKANDNTELVIREGRGTGKSGKAGKVIARVPVNVKSAQGPFRRDQSGQWLTLTAPLEYTPQGVTNLVLNCEGASAGAAVCVDWLQFRNRPHYFTPVPTGATVSHPDSAGFIRRWLLLEPIRQEIRSNVVFTNSWLRQAFSTTYFKDQMTLLPRDGQKVKVGGQTLTWRALDSETYNMRLFRFAERWGQQTYGSLFWAVTIIDSPEEMPDVRLAAGSNGASIWWLNGEEVLLLEGDRRMVQDDGMSSRLTLRKGRNILRCAVINGPGLSDMCVRFLDAQGKPITNLDVNLEELRSH